MEQRTSIKSRGFLLAICYAGFVSLGLPDTLIGVAWPSVRETFHLKQSSVSWIFFGSGCSYFLSSFFAGRMIKRFNVGLLLAGSSALVAVSALNYGVATAWLWFAFGALLHGLGSGAIDSGLNHYVATHFTARHMNWLHACYSLGAMLGPAIMTACIAEAGSWRLAYLIVAATLFILSVLFFSTASRWADGTSPKEPDSASAIQNQPTAAVSPSNALRNRTVQLHVLLFFLYTGLEVALGQWSFTVLTESRGIGTETAGTWVTIYWGSILAGRILFGFIVDAMRIDTLIRLSTVTALCGAALLAANPFSLASPVALALGGLGLAVIFPCLMTRTPQRVGKELAAHAIGFQVGAAMLGAAAIPSLCGFIAQQAGLQVVPRALLITAAALFVAHEILLLTAKRRDPGADVSPRP